MKALYDINRLLIYSETLEIIIPKFVAGQGFKNKIKFPQSNNLRNSFIMGMEAYYQEAVPLSTVSRELAVIPFQLMKRISVSLQQYDGMIFVSEKPLIDFKRKVTMLSPQATAQESDILNQYNVQFTDDVRFNWTKCFIDILDPTFVSTTEDQVVLFDVYYRDNPKVMGARKADFKNKK